MIKVTRKPEKAGTVMEQPTLSTKQLTSSSKRKKRKNRSRPRPICSDKVKKMQRGMKRLLHGSSRKKSSRSSTRIPRKVKRVKKAKKFRPLAKE
uniref:Uncharacterized protein n=1 Tax=Ailuropoda melanoleuca TaxID=9646 RepID=A0A7N5J8S0_AILME